MVEAVPQHGTGGKEGRGGVVAAVVVGRDFIYDVAVATGVDVGICVH